MTLTYDPITRTYTLIAERQFTRFTRRDMYQLLRGGYGCFVVEANHYLAIAKALGYYANRPLVIT